jgi:hypothetical protein
MLRVFSFVSKRHDITVAEFIDHYENHHVPLILSLAPAPLIYKRHYVSRQDDPDLGHFDLDFDAIVEQHFTDRAAFTAWITAVTTGPAGERVAADEARFLERARTRACVVPQPETGPANHA